MNESKELILLSTKLKIPVPRRDYVVRSALFEKLAACRDMSVIFVCGGAGTGKTTLLSTFLKESGLKNAAWISLDSSNNDVYSFWYYFAAAAEGFFSGGDDFLSFLRSGFDTSHMENLLTMLINRLCGEEDYYMVLDDVHCIRDEALTHTLEFFIGNMPENLHLFMLSREDPPVYLGVPAVSGRLLYLDGRQMQLSREEGLAFLKQTLKLEQSETELERLNRYAEGWIGGLQLAAAAGQAGKNPGTLLRAGGGIAVEYLTREVYESLTAGEQEFLLATGRLAYFDAEICGCLLEGFSPANFEDMIENLTQKNLFLICIDEKNGIYRYHNILSEYLTRQFDRLPAQEKASWLERCVTAFEQRGDDEEAMRQLSESHDYRNLMRVAHHTDGSMESWHYLDKIPLDLLIEDADLAAQCFIYNFGSLNVERGTALYEAFKEHYDGTDVFALMRFIEGYLSLDSGALPEYQEIPVQQIDRLHLGPVTKSMVFIENANALIDMTQYGNAEQCLTRALALCAGANSFVDAYAHGQKAQLYEEVGRLNESLGCYEQAMRLLRSPFIVSSMGVGFYVGLTGVYMRRMELDRAQEALDYARGLMEKQHTRMRLMEYELQFHVEEMKLLRGRTEGVAAFVTKMESGFPLGSSLNLARLLQEMDCEGLLEPALAQKFMEDLQASKNHRRQPFMRLLHARILLRRGETETALQETEEVLVFSRAQKNSLRLVEADLLKILILSQIPQVPENRRQMKNLLREAVYYAFENRIMLPFYLERRTVLPLLCELRDSDKSGLNAAESVFIRETAVLCGAAGAAKEAELLSARELDVLNALALGITNREIAEKLCISQATVKTHVLNIFGKLGVSSRLLAVEEGRKKGLIG